MLIALFWRWIKLDFIDWCRNRTVKDRSLVLPSTPSDGIDAVILNKLRSSTIQSLSLGAGKSSKSISSIQKSQSMVMASVNSSQFMSMSISSF
uniref:Uncharacterized protein n=1 Tax=Utricularia reniformis TaxID=192314 RepID=A0A1Y0AZN9_9LAMI|nr:hypothetical protein AEK19_MT0338 [Utricularia reniformis]ART30610.1 hypothetical protein AEK19_MT0338 [Utricularia reniformis]